MGFSQNIKSLFGTNPSATKDSDHINQEMYKKSAELNEKNKTLSLLQQLDAIVLSSITRLNEVAQSVTTLLVKEAAFENVAIFLFSKKDSALQRIGFSETEKTVQIPYLQTISLVQTNNLIAQSATNRVKHEAFSLENVLLSPTDFAREDIKQAIFKIKSVRIAPLVIRNELVGALVISLAEEDAALSETKKDLLSRLVDTVGIGIDNALLYNEVQETNKKLVILDQLKDEFVSVASHELRTPMTAIKSYLWMALEGRGGPITEKQKFYLDRAYKSVDRLIRLVNDMLNVSRIDSGRITIELTAIDLPVMIQEVFDEVMPRAQELSLALKMTPTVAPLPKVLADNDKIKEVLFNLIGNALKFTPKGGSINVSFVQKGEFIETTVSDTGTGILPEDISKLFQKFSMVDGSFSSDHSIQGTGLGLYISKSIIELHKGKIWVTSEGRDKGTQFIFSLPVIRDEDLQKIAKTQPDEDKKSMGIIHTSI